MAARPADTTCKSLIQSRTIQAAAAAVTAGMPVKLGTLATDVLLAGANEKAIGIALDSGVAGDRINVSFFGYAIVPVKVGTGGATHGEFAICAADGATNQTLGGGTTVKYVIGRFIETGVVGDKVGLLIGNFASGAA